jgi:hypothetical protein
VADLNGFRVAFVDDLHGIIDRLNGISLNIPPRK